LPCAVDHDEAGVEFFDCPRWREVTRLVTASAALLLPQLVHSAFICNAPLFRRVGAHSRSSAMATKKKGKKKKSKGM
jgi:hypothetical protein